MFENNGSVSYVLQWQDTKDPHKNHKEETNEVPWKHLHERWDGKTSNEWKKDERGAELSILTTLM